MAAIEQGRNSCQLYYERLGAQSFLAKADRGGKCRLFCY